MSRLVHNPGDAYDDGDWLDETGFLNATKPLVPQWSDDSWRNAGPSGEGCPVCGSVTCQIHRPASVLQEADKIIHGARQEQYGDPERNFERIARAWSAYLDQELSGHDVCMMMALLKIIRAHGDYHRDSLVDL